MCACSSVQGQDINKNDFPACPHLTVSGKWHATIDALLDGMAAVYVSNSMNAFGSPSVSFLWAAVKSGDCRRCTASCVDSGMTVPRETMCIVMQYSSRT